MALYRGTKRPLACGKLIIVHKFPVCVVSLNRYQLSIPDLSSLSKTVPWASSGRPEAVRVMGDHVEVRRQEHSPDGLWVLSVRHKP
jgi:hypothetical protein